MVKHRTVFGRTFKIIKSNPKNAHCSQPQNSPTFVLLWISTTSGCHFNVKITCFNIRAMLMGFVYSIWVFKARKGNVLRKTVRTQDLHPDHLDSRMPVPTWT